MLIKKKRICIKKTKITKIKLCCNAITNLYTIQI